MRFKYPSLKLFQFGFLIGTILLLSCRDDWKNTNWDGSWGIPIVKGSLKINKLIKTDKVQLGGTGALTLKYIDTLFYLDPKTVLNIRDTSILSKFNFPLNATIKPGYQIMSEAKEINYNLNDAEIVQFDLKEGNLSFEVKNTLKTNIIVYLTLPGAKKNGVAFKYRAFIPTTSTDSPWVSPKINLADYSISLKGQYLNKFNTIYYELNVYTDSAGTEVKYVPEDVLEVKTYFSNLNPSYIKGYFGSLNQRYQSSEHFIAFQNYVSGNVSVKDLNLKLSMDYSLGCDSKIKINEILGTNERNNSPVQLNHELIGKTINYTRQIDNGGTPGTNHSEYIMNSENSNILEFINNLPSLFNYDLSLTLNPNGNNSGGNDFIYTNKTFLAKTEMIVPLNLTINNLVLQDTIHLTPNYVTASKTKTSKLYLQTSNGYPVNVTFEIYAFNTITNKYELIADEITIPAAEEFDGDKIKNPFKNEIELPLGIEQTSNILFANKLIIKAKFNSTEAGKYYVLYDDYKLDYKIALSANVKVK